MASAELSRRVAKVGLLLAFVGFGVLPDHAASSPTVESAASRGTNGRIAFAVEESYPGSDAQSSLWVVTVRADGSKARRIDEAAAAGPVAYSPLGGRLAYANGLDGLIHAVRLTRPRRDRRITSPFYPPDTYPYDSGPDWSPSGRRIVFTRSYYDDSVGGVRSELWIHYFGGGRRLTDGASPSWSARGDIAFTGADDYMYTIRPNGSGLRRLAKSRCSDPDWSPDGERLVCAVGSDIASVRADGSDFRRLTHGRAQDGAPVFSPDGRWIAFARGGSSIITMRRDGTRLRTVAKRVSSDPDCCELTVYGPDWQPRTPR
jgi:hypothetical protein